MKKMIPLLVGLTLVSVSTTNAQVLNRQPKQTVYNAVSSSDAMRNGKIKITNVSVVPTASKFVRTPNRAAEQIDVLKEDFSGMSAGSYESPELTIPLWYPSDICPIIWQNMIEGYTQLPKWGCDGAYPAGGSVFLRAESKKYSMAHLNTPMLNLAGNDGVAVLEFDARTKPGVTVEDFIVEFAETNNMGSSWGNTGGGLVKQSVTETWNTYRLTFEGTGPSTIFNIVTSKDDLNAGNPASIFIDNVRVYQEVPVIARPTALPHSNYKGSSFQANWKAQDKAVSYLLNVYMLDDNQNKTFVLEKQPVNGTSYEVTGLRSGYPYHYDVAAVDAEGNVSRNSFPIEVFDIEAPTISSTDINDKGIYTASWTAAPSAEVYNYYAAFKRTIKEDGQVYVTNENLNNLTFEGAEPLFDPVAEGGETNLDTYPGRYVSFNLSEMRQAGWTGIQYTPCKGYAAIDNWLYIANPDNEPMGSLQSPELELEKNNGHFKVALTLAGEPEDMSDWMDEQGNPMEGIYYPRAIVALFTYDEKAEDFVQVETQILQPDVNWKEYECEFTKGTNRSLVCIFANRIPGMLFVDNIRILQDAKKGDVYNEPFLFTKYIKGTSVDVEIPGHAKDEDIWHKVCGVKGRMEGQDNFKKTEGHYSEYTLVGKAVHTDIQMTLHQKLMVTVEGNTVCVNNPAGKNVEVYAADGKLVKVDRSGNANVSIPLPQQGVYLVKVGNRTVKITF